LGQVGLDWQIGGFAADPPTGAAAAMGDSSQLGQLVQAMAGFGGSVAADGSNTGAVDAAAPQETLLMTPPHA